MPENLSSPAIMRANETPLRGMARQAVERIEQEIQQRPSFRRGQAVAKADLGFGNVTVTVIVEFVAKAPPGGLRG